MNCPTCGQLVPDPTAVHYITDAELDALSAWWWTRMTWIAIVIGAVVVSFISVFLLPDWAGAIGYGVGLFVGRWTARREFLELIESMRR